MSVSVSGRVSRLRRAIVFIDGENLCVRYERMTNDPGRKLNTNGTVTFDRGKFLWHPNLASLWDFDVLRVVYYMSVAGTDETSEALSDQIAATVYGAGGLNRNVVPKVFKKAKSDDRSKSVDINLCIDVLRHTYLGNLDSVVLLSGDGDYLPLIREVMRQGCQAYVAAFSSGLNSAIRRTVDGFQLLDGIFFFE